jgi:colanic acid biosynthesis glycosyl transferase WcaI
MRILLHDFSGHPFQIQLSRELARRGHSVYHLYSEGIIGAKGNLDQLDSNLEVEAISIGHDINRYNFAKRLLDERQYGQVLAKRLESIRPDVFIASNTPLDALFSVIPVCKKNDIKFVFWLQDILGLAATSILQQKLGAIGKMVGQYYSARERRILRQSDHVIPISDDFLDVLADWCVPQSKITVINNWAPIEEMPALPRQNSWSTSHSLDDKKVVLYSGALGLKHNPRLLLELAKTLHSQDPEYKLVVISEGYGADWLTKKNSVEKLPNLLLLPFQPYDELPSVLATGDIVLAILEPDAGTYCVPSKVLSYLCVGRAIVLAASESNLASKIVTGSGGGIVTSPSDVDEFCTAVLDLLKNPDKAARMGKNARRYAEATFDITKIGNAFEEVVGSLCDD